MCQQIATYGTSTTELSIKNHVSGGKDTSESIDIVS